MNIEDDKCKSDAKLQSAKELIQSLQSGATVEKILEWHNRMDVIQLREVHAKRMAERHSQEADNLKDVVNKQEKIIIYLEEMNLKLESQLREKELEIDNRDLEFLEGLSSNRGERRISLGVENIIHPELVHSEASTINEPEGFVPEMPQDPLMENDTEEDSVLSEPPVSDTGSEIRTLQHTIVSLERRIREAEDALKFREEALNNLISRMPTELAERTGSQRTQDNELHLVDFFETKQNLSVAQATIDCLQARLNHKEESLLRYQELISKTKDEMIGQKLQHENELFDLQNRLQTVQSEAVFSKTQEITKNLDEHSLIQELNTNLQSKITALEESLTVNEHNVKSLSKRLHESQEETVDWKIKANNITKELEKERDRTKQEMFLRLQNVAEAKRHEDLIHKLKRNLETEVSNRPAQANELKNIVKQLKYEISIKEKQLRDLNSAINKMRSEIENLRSVAGRTILLKTMPVTVPVSPKISKIPQEKAGSILQDGSSQTDQDLQIKEYQEKMHILEKQKETLKRDMKSKDDQINELAVELDALRMNFEQNEEFLEKILKENEELQKSIDRTKKTHSASTQNADDNAEEIAELRQTIRSLEEQILRHEPPEKPYVEDEKAQKSREELVRWEESKKWQLSIERYKQKSKDKEQEVDSLEKSNKSLRDQLTKIGKEKNLLENRVKALSVKSSPSDTQELKKQVAQLEQRLNLQNSKNKDQTHSDYQELKTKNNILVDKIFQLEKQLAKYSVSKEAMANATREAFNDDTSLSFKEKYGNLQRHVLKLSEENFELKIETEHLKIDIPRLTSQITSLEALVKVLKSDLQTKETMIKQLMHPEDAENSKSQFKLPDTKSLIRNEIHDLENENRARSSDVSSIISRSSPQKHGSSTHRLLDVKMNKIVLENSRLQQDILRCQLEIDQLHSRNKTLADQNRRALDSLEEKERHIIVLKKQIPTPHSMPPRQYKSYVVTKMYEEKITSLEKDLAVTKDELQHSMILLKEFAEKEEFLRMDTEKLRMKVQSLEKYSTSDSADDELLLLKSRVLSLEEENQELLGRLLQFEPEQLHCKERVSIYDVLLRENAELRVALRLSEMRTNKHE